MFRKNQKLARLGVAHVKRRRLAAQQRLWFAEQLEARTAPGSMLVDVLTPAGNPPVRLEPSALRGTERCAVRGNRANDAGEPRAVHDPQRGGRPGTNPASQLRSYFSRGQTDFENAVSPAARASRAISPEPERPNHASETACGVASWPDESVLLVASGLEDGLEASCDTSSPTVRRLASLGVESAGHAGTGGGLTGDAPLPLTPPAHLRGASRADAVRAHDVRPSTEALPVGAGCVFPGVSATNSVGAGGIASGMVSTEFVHTDSTVATTASDHATVGSGTGVEAARPSESPTHQTSETGYSSEGRAIALGFEGGLADWNLREAGGSPAGRGRVTEGSAILHEGDSFLVTIDKQFAMGLLPQSLSFTYEAFFDTSDPDFVNDAFEAALLDADGFSLVDTYLPGRDSYFNLTEGLSAALAQGVSEQQVTWPEATKGVAHRVSVDLADVPSGTSATLVFRLVNNDTDTHTYVRIFDAGLVEEDVSSIGGYVYVDVNKNGVKEAREMPLPNVPIRLTQDLTGDVLATTVTDAKGWYEFTDLPPGTYSISELQPAAFLDGLETPGTPALGQCANDLFFGMELPAHTYARDFNFGEQGLRPEFISKQFFLASTPDMNQLLPKIVAPTGADWFKLKADSDGELVVQIAAPNDGLTIELYSEQMVPLALSRDKQEMAAPVAEGECYVLHVAGPTGDRELVAHLAIHPKLPVYRQNRFFLDVNADGWVSPLDALLVIDQLNGDHCTLIASGSRRYTFDVSQDGSLSPLDALLVIDYLNRYPFAEGEYDTSMWSVSTESDNSPSAWATPSTVAARATLVDASPAIPQQSSNTDVATYSSGGEGEGTVSSPPQSPTGDSLLDAMGVAVFTTTEDFQLGSQFNVNATDVADELRLNQELSTFPYIWIANAGEGSISKLDIHTGQELARYRTGPNSLSASLSPSRTTVTGEGDVWVGNRAFGIQGSVVKVFHRTFVDRNGNGVCDTSRDINGDGRIDPTARDYDGDGVLEYELLPWDDNRDGIPDDERIGLVIQAGRDRINPQILRSDGVPRAVAIDANDDIWVGLYNLRQYEVYDHNTGELMAIVPTSGNPYGALIDQNGQLWGATYSGSILDHIDTNTRNYVEAVPTNSSVYGIAIDEDGVIWMSDYGNYLKRYDPATGSKNYYYVGGWNLRGVGIDLDRNVWVASTGTNEVIKAVFAADHRTHIGTVRVPVAQGDYGGPTSAVRDADGFIWTTTLDTGRPEGGRAWKIDPATNTLVSGWPVPVGAYPYNYSDMTGITRLTVTKPTGTWTEILDSEQTGYQWGTIVLDTEEPAGTDVRLRLRAADSRDLLESLAWQEVASATELSDYRGRYLEVEVTLQSDQRNVTPVVRAVVAAPLPALDIAVKSPPDGTRTAAGTSQVLCGQAFAAPLRAGTEIVASNAVTAVYINGSPVDVLDSAGNFFATVQVSPGNNVLVATAVDAFGQTATTSITLEGTQLSPQTFDLSRLADLTASFKGEYGRTSFDEKADLLYADLAIRNQGRYEAGLPLVVGIAHLSDPNVYVCGVDGVLPDGTAYYDFSDRLPGPRLFTEQVTSERTLCFYNPKRVPFTYELLVFGALNQPPEWITVPVSQVALGNSYVYDSAGRDADADALAYALVVAPSGMSIDQVTGQIRWRPETSDEGTHAILLHASDGRGGVAEQSFAISVVPPVPNQSPRFMSRPVVDAYVDQPYVYDVDALDPESDTVTYSFVQFEADSLTGFSGIQGNQGWSYGYYDRSADADGRYQAAEFRPFPTSYWTGSIWDWPGGPPWTTLWGDGGHPNSTSFGAEHWVIRRYEAPAEGNVRIEGSLAKIDTTARSGNAGVTGRIFVDGVEVFSQFIAGTDGVGVDFAIDAALQRGSMIDFVIDPAGAADYDSTRFTAHVASVPPPSGMSIDSQTGMISWTPEPGHVGPQRIVVQVSDGRGDAVRQDYTLQIHAALSNHAPIVISEPITRALVGQPYASQVTAIDPDGDPLIYRITQGPDELAVDPLAGLLAWDSPRVGLHFDGANDFLITPNLRGEFADESVTLELWFKAEKAGVIAAELGQYVTNTGWHDSQLEILASGEVKARVWNLSPVSLGTVAFGEWHHVALRYDKSSSTLDGLLDGAVSVSIAGDRAAPWESAYGLYYAFGASDTTNMGSGAYFAGTLHDVRVWNRARTTSEIVTDMNRMVDSSAPGLIANWRLVEGSGGIAADRTSHAFHASLGGGATASQPEWPTPEIIVLEAVDTSGAFDTQTFTIAVYDPIPNAPPSITSTPPGVGAAGRTYVYDLAAEDADGDSIRFGLWQYPAGMSIDSLTGRVTWTPAAEQVGMHTVIVQVTDGRSGTDQQSFDVQVFATLPNQAPRIVSAPPDAGVVGQRYVYDALASDPDFDLLIFDLPVRPDGMVIDPTSGMVAWVPSAGQVGLVDVVLRVRDGQGGVDLQAVRIDVAAANNNPLITSTPQTLVTPGQSYRYLIRAQDADGDALIYSLMEGPTGMSINAATGSLTWDVPYSNGLRFDGNDYVATPLRIDQSGALPGVTMEAWVRPTNTHDEAHYYVIGTDNGGHDWSIYRAGGQWQVLSGENFRDTGMRVEFDTWQHVAATFIPGVGVRFQKNGEEVLIPYIGYDSYDNPIAIGTNPGFGGRFVGDIDEVRVWKTPRSAEEIRAAMHLSLAGDEPGLVGYWRFDEGTGTTTYDASSHGNLGTLGGGNSASVPTWIRSQIPDAAHVSVQVSDGRGGTALQTYTLQIALDVPNDPPVITSQPRKTMRLGNTYFYQVAAWDPNADPLDYSFENAPLGMTIDAAGLVQWVPDEAQLGSHLVTIRVDDGRTGFMTQTYTIDVVTDDANRPPRIVSAPVMRATVASPYRYDALAVDYEGDPAVWSLVAAPEGMSLDRGIGTLRWTPQFDQLGPQSVTLRVTDALGASSMQTFEVMVRGINVPPTLSSSPPTRVNAGDFYSYAVRATDPDGDPLSFVLRTGPEEMILDKSTGFLRWRPQIRDEGEHLVQLRVEDGQGGVATQEFVIQVRVAPPNHAPVITSHPTIETRVAVAYQYLVTAHDSDGELPRFELLDGPAGMSIDSETGKIEWTPIASQIGVHTVTVMAADAAGAGCLQTYGLLVREANRAPEILSSPTLEVTAGLPYRYDVWAQDPDGDLLHYRLTTAPAGMQVDAVGRITWRPDLTSVGLHDVGLMVADELGASHTQSFAVSVGADVTAPSLILQVSQNPAALGTTVDLIVKATDNVGVKATKLTVAGTVVALDTSGKATTTVSQIGSFPVVAIAVDAAGNETQSSEMLLVIDPSVVGAPVPALKVPAANSVITASIDVVGTVDDPDLLYYSLSVAPFGTTDYREISRGTQPVVDGKLGRLDPSLLNNDSYVLRLYAVDTGGNDASTQITFSVAGELKLGNFTLAFNDLTIPVSGIPITVTRTYDTLQARESGELGYGWSLGFRDTRLRTNVARTGLEGAGIYGAFHYGTRVYLTLPGGRREGFTFRPVSESFFGLTLYYPAFIGDAGVTSTLTVPQVTLQPKPDGFHEFGLGGPAYNPASYLFGGSYTLTTKEGLVYDIDAQTGQLLTVTDRNQNTLTFSDEGIASSSGRRVDLQRDSRGRITAVIDPLGNRIRYQYDQRGDLVAVTDRGGNVTRFVYRTDRAHYVDKVIDPLGRTGVRTEYDEKGRLLKLFDAQGNPVEMIHDLDNAMETVLDAMGQPTTYEYDSHGNIVRETDTLGGVTRRTYDAQSNLLTETDPLGRQTTFSYDTQRNVLSETDPLGNVTRRTYDSFGNVLTVTDPLGHTSRNQYDSRGNLLATTDPSGLVTQFHYDGAGNLLTVIDSAGNPTQYAYNTLGELTRQIDALGHGTEFTYDANGNRVTEQQEMTTPDGFRTVTTTTQYDARGHAVSRTDPEGHTQQYEYDQLCQKVGSLDALGRRTQFLYDARGSLIETILPDATPNDLSDNPRLRSEYDAAGRKIAQVDELGRRTQFVYDAIGQLTTTIYPDETPASDTDNPRTTIEYDAAGQVVAQVDELGHRTEFEYDRAGRQIVVRDALGNETTTAHDASGNILSNTDALGHATRFEYDDAGRRVGIVFADGSRSLLDRDSMGRVVSSIDQAGHVTTFEYDALGRLTGLIDALSQRTEYGYDELGNLISQTDGNQHVTTFEYDGLGRKTATTLPLGQRSETTYDAVGNVMQVANFNGDVVEYQYDAHNRLVRSVFPDGGTVQYTYTPNGLRETVTDGRGTTYYQYDARDRLIRRTDPDGRQIAYDYDDTGNRTSVTIPSGTTTYAYDSLNRLLLVTDPAIARTQYHYDAIGRLVQTDMPNATVETRQYDDFHRLTYLEHAGPHGVIASYSYELDDVGNRIAVTEQNGRRVEYAYDELYRLIGESISDAAGGDRTIQYTYDPVGNRLTRDDLWEGLTRYIYDDNDRLLSETLAADSIRYEYDANGNVRRRIDDATDQVLAEYQWDWQGRLVAADMDGDGTCDVHNQYDASGNRVVQRVDGEETRFLIDTNRPYVEVLEEYSSSGTTKTSYVHGLDLISQKRVLSGTNYEQSFYHVDGLGSTRLLTDVQGNVLNRYAYDAFGRIIQQSGPTANLYLYAGEQRDAILGLDYLRARYLDTSTGRFVSADPFEGAPGAPLSLHRYLYANDQPVNSTDPSGLLTLPELMVRITIVTTLFILTPRVTAFDYVASVNPPQLPEGALTTAQIQVLRRMLAHEKIYGTWSTAWQFSNTVGDTPMGSIFDDRPVRTAAGVLDLDWYTDLIAFSGGYVVSDLPLGRPSVYLFYGGGKLVWNVTRKVGSWFQDIDTPVAWWFQDPKESQTVKAILSGRASYEDLFPPGFLP